MHSEPQNQRTRDSIDHLGGDLCSTDCEEVFAFAATPSLGNDDEVYYFESMQADAPVATVNHRVDDSKSAILNTHHVHAPDSNVISLGGATQLGMISGETADSRASSTLRVGILSFAALCVVCLILCAISMKSTNHQTSVVHDLSPESRPKTTLPSLENVPEVATDYAEEPEVVALYRTGIEHYEAQRYHEAMRSYEAALKLDPSNAIACNNLALLLATCPQASYRHGTRARALSRIACQRTKYEDWKFLSVRASAEAESGEFDQAIKFTELAIAIAPADWHPYLRKMILQFQRGEPYRWP